MATFPPPLTLHKASGQARVRWQGRDYYLGKYGTPAAAANYARLLAELAAGRTPPRRPETAPLTVAQVVADWVQRVLPSYNPQGGEPDAFARSLAPLLQLYAGLPAADLDTAKLEAVRQEMIRRGWCRNVINRRVVRIKTLWRWAEAQGYVPRGSWAHLRTLPGLRRNNCAVRQTERVQPASWVNVKKVLPFCPPAPRTMLLLQWWAGLRSAEVCTLREPEIDRGGVVWIYRPVQHKNAWRGQERLIALGRKCQSLLKPWLARVGAEGWLFVHRLGRPYSSCSYARAIWRACQQAGVRLHPYQCRHAFKLRVTRLLGLDAARAALGQSSLTSTNGYAAQQDVQLATEVAKKLS